MSSHPYKEMEDCSFPFCKERDCKNFGNCIEYCLHTDPSFIDELIDKAVKEERERWRGELGNLLSMVEGTDEGLEEYIKTIIKD